MDKMVSRPQSGRYTGKQCKDLNQWIQAYKPMRILKCWEIKVESVFRGLMGLNTKSEINVSQDTQVTFQV